MNNTTTDDYTSWDALSDWSSDNKEQHKKTFFSDAIPLIERFVKDNKDLEFSSFNSNHFRIKNTQTNKFIDVWHTRTMRKINGEYGGCGYKEKNLHKELRRLTQDRPDQTDRP